MYYNPLTKEEEFHELVKEIERQSAYKRVPSPGKKYMSVAEMGRFLGLKKTDRYWLVHKNFFKTEVILGKMRVELESFEKWYANQIKYHKITGEEPGQELKQRSYLPKDIAEILQISEWQVYEEMQKADVEGSMRMPEMARMLGVSRSVVYNIIACSDILKTIELDGRRRVTKESFYEWYASQDRYHIVSEQAPETVKKEDNRSIETYRRAVQDRDGHTKNIGNDAYLTVKEAALLAGINPATVHKWIKKGKIEAVQSSKTVRIPRQAFENWLQSRKKEDQHGINC